MLVAHQGEFQQFAQVVPADDKEIIFMGIHSRGDYEKAKEQQRKKITEEALAPEVVAFLEAPTPATLPPIIIQLQPQPQVVQQYVPLPQPTPPSSGFGPQGIAGVLFTMWLIYNMS